MTLPFSVKKDESGDPLEADVWAVTTDGTRVLVVGGYAHAPCASLPPGGADTGGGGPGCPLAPISWISTDGVNWTSGFPGPRPVDPPGYDQGSEFVAAWAVPTGGWDAALSYWQGESLTGRDLMHSADGLKWVPLAPLPDADVASDYPPFAHAGAADAAGRRVTWGDWLTLETGTDNPQSRFVATVATSPEGGIWTAVDGFPGQNAHVLLGLAPVGGGASWVLAGSSGAADGWTATSPTIWSSADAATWTRIGLPVGAPVSDVTGLVHSRVGYVAVSGYRYGDMWSTGDPDVHETWLSGDGVRWVELPVSGPPGADYGPGLVADGPAGVIGISQSPSDPDRASAVWQLR